MQNVIVIVIVAIALAWATRSVWRAVRRVKAAGEAPPADGACAPNGATPTSGPRDGRADPGPSTGCGCSVADSCTVAARCDVARSTREAAHEPSPDPADATR